MQSPRDPVGVPHDMNVLGRALLAVVLAADQRDHRPGRTVVVHILFAASAVAANPSTPLRPFIQIARDTPSGPCLANPQDVRAGINSNRVSQVKKRVPVAFRLHYSTGLCK